MLWDEGTWEPVGDPEEGLAKGDFKFILHGERLKGKWVLVRIKSSRGKRQSARRHENWLLIKERDEYAGDGEEADHRAGADQRALRPHDGGDRRRQVEWVEAGFQLQGRRRAAISRRRKRQAGEDGDARSCSRRNSSRRSSRRWSRRRRTARTGCTRSSSTATASIAAVGGGKAVDLHAHRPRLDRQVHADRAAARRPAVHVGADRRRGGGRRRGRAERFRRAAERDRRGQGQASSTTPSISSSLDGEDLRKLPLIERKERLATLLADQPRTGPLFYSDHVVGNGGEIFERACAMKLEGIVSKRADAPYRSERTQELAEGQMRHGPGVHHHRLAAVDGEGAAVLVAPGRRRATSDRLAYRGRVGSGFGERELTQLWPELEKRAVKTPPADDVPRRHPARRRSSSSRSWSPRSTSPAGPRTATSATAPSRACGTDKKAGEVVREMPKDRADEAEARAAVDHGRQRTATTARSRSRACASPIPNRVVFAGQKITKRKLIDYYLAVADLILPHVADRPLSLVRCPGGRRRRLLLPEARLAGLPRRLQADPHQGEGGQGRVPLHRGRAGPGRRGADGRARAPHLGLAHRDAGEARPHRLRLRPRRGGRLRRGQGRRRRRCATG